jgi:methylenetetrahydrofolate reductase (NADPH)
VSKLLTVSAPDDLLDGLAKLHSDRPELRIAAPHFYPFGGFDKLFDWLSPKLMLAEEPRTVIRVNF